MSWFKRIPPKYPPKNHTVPHRSSPATEKIMKEALKIGPQKETTNKHKHDH